MSTGPEPDLVAERELIELFRPQRPDPEAFRAGVARKLEQLKGEEDSRGEDGVSTGPTWLRRAAAFLPIDLASGSAAGSKLAPAATASPASRQTA
jgi:hypothetical protein